METIIGQPQGGDHGGDLIKDSDQQAFGKDVIEASMRVPVIVDFWAPWCGPCKQLGPALESAVKAARGAVRMVKINVDENQMLAQQLRIQSIPMVVAFFQGRPVDGFQGAIPESQIKQFIARLVGDRGPAPSEQMLEQATAAFNGGDISRAAALYAEVHRLEPDNVKAVAGLAKCYIRSGELDGARALLDGLPASAAHDSDVAGARAALTLADDVRDAGDPEAARAAVDSNPDDHQARYDLARALIKAQQYEDAVRELVEIVRRDREWQDDAARKQLLKLFEAFGPASQFTQWARRQLSSVLFS
ncbi:MAG: co-chaperone YbbN [Alphaproteobacteria bacterium]|nr:MAG: co-chaperone YbbN [Alphaproteobacteria bacterium]